MRVLVVTNMYPPHHLGGYELSCRDVVERWRAAGHEVAVLTSDIRLDGAAEASDPAYVRRDLAFYWRSHEILSPPLRTCLRMERRSQGALHRALDKLRPDVVSFWHMGAMPLGLLTSVSRRGLPAVYVVCDDWLLYATTVDRWTATFARHPRVGRGVERITGTPTRVETGPDTTFCFVSAWIRERARERTSWPIHRSAVVYSGIETADFTIPDTGRRPWRWRMLCVGRVEERKGAHVAVEALAHLPAEATLEILGPADDRYLEKVRTIATDLGVADRLTYDVVPRAALADRYREADVFVFPVLWDEPFGLVPVEAMACGTPVVATGTGGSAEFSIDNANCLLVPPGDPQALAAAVSRLAEDPDLRSSLVAGGRTTAEELTMDRYAEVLEAWHRAAAERFALGEPDPRPTVRDVLASRGLS